MGAVRVTVILTASEAGESMIFLRGRFACLMTDRVDWKNWLLNGSLANFSNGWLRTYHKAALWKARVNSLPIRGQ